MDEDLITVQLALPHEAVAEERAAGSDGYRLGAETPMPPDPDAVEARFVDPVTLTAVVTMSLLAWRIVNHYLVRDGRGVLVDARQVPALVSRLEDVPAGYILLIKPDGKTQTIDAGKVDDKSLADVLKASLKLP